MTKKFLNKLKTEGKLEIINPSEEISLSYSYKSSNCFKSAKILLQNNLYDNSVSMSYYAMYNQLTALLFNVGIKCENHTGSIMLLKELFEKENLFNIISNAKKERIDKDYYVTTEKNGITKEIAQELLIGAEKFIIETKIIINQLNYSGVQNIRQKFDEI